MKKELINLLKVGGCRKDTNTDSIWWQQGGALELVKNQKNFDISIKLF